MALDISKIKKVNFPETEYYKEESKKTQIVLHHTVSGAGIDGDVNSWIQGAGRIATPFIIERDGTINQCFESKYWAHHLGVTSATLKNLGFSDYGVRNNILNKQSIAIEIDSWGGLVKDGSEWYPALWDGKKYVANKKVKPIQNVTVYDKPYKGFYGFEAYTDAALSSAKDLIEFLAKRYGIALGYNSTMFEQSKDALAGKPGVWTHTSFRSDKSDCHPQPSLIEMLKTLK